MGCASYNVMLDNSIEGLRRYIREFDLDSILIPCGKRRSPPTVKLSSSGCAHTWQASLKCKLFESTDDFCNIAGITSRMRLTNKEIVWSGNKEQVWKAHSTYEFADAVDRCRDAPLYAHGTIPHFLVKIVESRKVISQDDNEYNIDTKFWAVPLEYIDTISFYAVPTHVGDGVFVRTVAILRFHDEATKTRRQPRRKAVFSKNREADLVQIRITAHCGSAIKFGEKIHHG